MKKYLFSLIFLLVSYVGFSQKGLSYQAIILDPAKIEIPGQDISSQPLVNGDVWLKFSIFNGSTLQFEEVHKTKTDNYGLVNLLIGSVSSASFNSLVWDGSQKSLQVFVSFNQGGSYTKIADQKLTYNPYALFAETAGKLGATLPISGGGTGATTAADARANLGLDQVNNTSDAAKPVSTATQTALNLKANTADMNTALGLKSNATDVAAGLALKANTADVTSALDLKANTSDVNATLALKANNADVTTALDLKANASDMTAALAAKADTGTIKTFVVTQVAAATIADADANSKGKIQLAGDLGGTADAPTVPGLALKANTSDMTSALALKADAADVTTALALKANGSTVATSLNLKENAANKSLNVNSDGSSDIKYPSVKAVKDYVDARVQSGVSSASIADADANTKGKIQLAGDLGGTAAVPTVPGLALKANAADVTTLTTRVNANTASITANSTAINSKAPLASPTFTGTVSAPIYASTPQILTAGATINWNPANGLNASVTLDQNSTLRFTTTPAVGSYGTLVLTQDATGGRTITLPSTTNKVLGSTSSTTIDLSTAANAIDIVNFYYDGTNYFWNIGQGYGAAASASSTGVPYTGATGRVDLGAYNLTVNGLTVGKGVNSISSNVAVGVSALAGTGNFNTAFGNNVLASSSQTGIYNNAFGYYSLNMNTSGRDNTAMGTTALYRNTTGESNSAFGNQALGNSVTGSNNTALGYQPLYLNTSGSENTATGYQALYKNTIGSFNTAIGKFALYANVDGNYNTAIGNSADVASATLTNATAIGNGAIVSASNAIQLGNSSVTNVKTSGTLTAGAVTYPKVHGTANQVLSTTGSGTLTWTSITSGGGDASTLTGVVSVANGGTGTTTVTGLVKGNGTSAMSAAVAGTDYLAPNGSAASLTNFPTLNQNTTGNAATATLATTATTATNATTAGNITATSNTTLTSLANLTTVGTITSGTWSGTAIAVANGGTGATNAADARTNLGLVIGTNVQAPLVAGTDYLAPNGSAASLTNFPTLNQNTTGNAATATLAGNITATSNTTLTSLTGLNTVGTITSGTISLTTDIKTTSTLTAGTVTYPNTHGSANQVLSTTGSGTLTWTTPSSGSSNTHYIGESYGGGVVFYTWDNGAHGLIVSLTDQCCNSSTIGRFSAGTATNTLAYNGSGGALVNNQTAYTTLTGGGVGAGKKNTLLIIASQGLGNGDKYAARYANEYSILSDGVLYDDWYLGSVDEYHLLANNYPQVLANNSFTPLNGPNKDYWTSTEINLTDAFTVYIRTNSDTSNIFNVFPNDKSMFNNGGYGNVRAIRSF